MSEANEELREALATYAHEAWSGWMSWQFDCGLIMPVMVGNKEIQAWVMPPSSYDRWQRQMSTSYANLPEDEKASDRDEADKILAIVYGDANP